jgi:DNA repair exonuclease SbcCD ATPase subunit
MKLNKWMVWLLVVAFLASEIFLFSALRQKEALQVSVQTQKQRADDLQTQVDSLQNSDAGLQGAEISKLRADNQDLPRLRNQVTQLQAANQKLTQQLKATSAYAQQQQAQLQQLADENQAFRAANDNQAHAPESAPPPAPAPTQAESDRNTCINNLRQIDAAKQQWALEKNKSADAVPTAQDLMPYFKDGNFPICPSGGTYSINAVDELPACSVPGHVLPQ